MNTTIYKTSARKNVNPVIKATANSAGEKTAKTNAKTIALNTKVALYARSHHHILVTGERGTGKTTLAREIHERSIRGSHAFVTLNCATLQAELVEAELFGYEKGAFTGANQSKMGLFETGSGGTIFLDEIGELPLALQAKLLKAVEERRIRRIGATREIPVDLRIIAATSRNLRQMTINGEFRADLYDRLNVLGLHTIPLREQQEKISELVRAGLERERNSLGCRKSIYLEPAAVSLLEYYPWTGNFRELHNFISKMAIEFCDAETITENEVRVLLASKDYTTADQLILSIDLNESLDIIIEDVKERYIFHHLKSKSHRRTAMACGISRSMIRRIVNRTADFNLEQPEALCTNKKR